MTLRSQDCYTGHTRARSPSPLVGPLRPRNLSTAGQGLQMFRRGSVPATRKPPLQLPNRRPPAPLRLPLNQKKSPPSAIRPRPGPKPKPRGLARRLHLRLRLVSEASPCARSPPIAAAGPVVGPLRPRNLSTAGQSPHSPVACRRQPVARRRDPPGRSPLSLRRGSGPLPVATANVRPSVYLHFLGGVNLLQMWPPHKELPVMFEGEGGITPLDIPPIPPLYS
jgi:hypothetical protein